MAISLKILSASQVVRYDGATVVEFPMHTQKVLVLYWMGVQVHPSGNGIDFIIVQSSFSLN